MTLKIGLSSVPLNLLEPLVPCLEIKLTCCDFLGISGAGGKIFSVFSGSA